MKVSQKLAILIKNLYLSKQYGARILLSALPDKGQKNLRGINSLLKKNCKTGTIVRQPGSGRPHSARSSVGPRAQSGGQAKKALISSWEFARNCHSPFKCALFIKISSSMRQKRRAQLSLSLANHICLPLTDWVSEWVCSFLTAHQHKKAI